MEILLAWWQHCCGPAQRMPSTDRPAIAHANTKQALHIRRKGMKFTYFELMPWPYLPDDFREKHRSVWVDIDRTLYDPVKGHAVYNEYLDMLEEADTMGFDGIGVNEHHQNAYGLMPSPNIIAASLARRTSRSALVVLGNSIALYNRGRGIRHARRDFGWQIGGRFPGRHLHGHQLLLWYGASLDARKIRRGARTDHASLARG
jgi:hypothetical protein